MLPDKIEHVAADFAFADDNKTFFYLKLQPGTARAYRLMRHVLGTDPKTDKAVFEEKDEQFELSLTRSKGGRVLLLTSEQTNTSEVRFLDAAKPDGAWTVIKPRAKGVRYFADEVGGQSLHPHQSRCAGLSHRDGDSRRRRGRGAIWSRMHAGRLHRQLRGDGRLSSRSTNMRRAARASAFATSKSGDETLSCRSTIRPATCRSPTTFTLPERAQHRSGVDDFALRLLVAVPADDDLRLRRRRPARSAKCSGRQRAGYRSVGLCARARVRAGAGRQADSGDDRLSPRQVRTRQESAAGLRLRRLWVEQRSGRSVALAEPARPRLRASPSRMCAAGARWARRGIEDGKLRNKKNTFTDFIAVAEYLVKAGYGDPEAHLRDGTQRRRPDGRRGREHAARSLQGHRRRTCRSSTW